MYQDQTYDVILKRMLDRVPNSIDKRESSLIWDTYSATAIELQILYIELETLIANSYGDTAGREFLILLCKDRGIEPESATNAILLGEFTPKTIDVLGNRFNIGDMNYIVTEKIADGQYQVQCETTGIIGNQYLGQMIPIEYINGLETATLTELLIPGEDEEDTEVLRKRYFDSFNEQNFGGNHADYLAKVRGVDGVGNCKITRVWNSDISPSDMIPTNAVIDWYATIIDSLDEEVALWLSAVYSASLEKKLTIGGTVLVTMVDSDDYGEVSETLISRVQELLDPEKSAGEGYGLAPIGHVVNVKSAIPVKIFVTATIIFESGFSWENLSETITETIEQYLFELRKEWAESSQLIVRISQIESRILGIRGVMDISDTKINESTDNFILGEYEIPIVGGVSE